MFENMQMNRSDDSVVGQGTEFENKSLLFPF